MKERQSNCLLCGAELVYLEQSRTMTCAVCGRLLESGAACANGHFVCDACHSRGGVAVILEACGTTAARDPIAIMRELMRHPAIHMHGPEHHVLVGAALLAAYRNCGGALDLDAALAEMALRGGQVPGGACGMWGCCGAAVSAGIFASIVTGSSPLKTEEWSLCNHVTAAALDAIAGLGGPRCCKRDSFTAARIAAAFSREKLGVELELPPEIRCEFYPLNRECLGERCPYHPPLADLNSTKIAQTKES